MAVGPSWDPPPIETPQEMLGTDMLLKQAEALPIVATSASDETALSLVADKDDEAIPPGELFFLGESQTSSVRPQPFRIPVEVVRIVLGWARYIPGLAR